MSHDEYNNRRILLDLGIGDFNATMVLPYMFMGPAQTDPAMAQVRLLTKAIQQRMIKMGATWIVPSGVIDEPTAHCLQALIGPEWNETSWGELASSISIASGNGKKFARPTASSSAVSLSGMGFLPAAPDIPGGIVTYAIGAYFVVRYLMKKGR